MRVPITIALLAISLLLPASANAAPMLTVKDEIHAFDADGDDIAWLSMNSKNGLMAVWARIAGGTPVKIHTSSKKILLEQIELVGDKVVFSQRLGRRDGRESTAIYQAPVGGGAVTTVASGDFQHAEDCGRAVSLIGVGSDGSIFWEDASRNGAACLSIGDVVTLQKTAADGSVTEVRRATTASSGRFDEKRSYGGSVKSDRIVFGGFNRVTVIDRNTAAQLYTVTAPAKRFFGGADISEAGHLAFSSFGISRRSATGYATLVTDLAANTVKSIGKRTVRKGLLVAMSASFCGERILRFDVVLKRRSFMTGLKLMDAGGVNPLAIRNTKRIHAFSAVDCDASAIYISEQSQRTGRTSVTRLEIAG